MGRRLGLRFQQAVTVASEIQQLARLDKEVVGFTDRRGSQKQAHRTGTRFQCTPDVIERQFGLTEFVVSPSECFKRVGVVAHLIEIDLS